MRTALLAVFCLGACSAFGADRTIGVFVALADNESQGLVPVPKAIGKGDDPEHNLYWGASEGLKGVFDRSPEWKLQQKNDTPVNAQVLRERVYRHEKGKATLTAKAYHGAFIEQCIRDFETAIQTRSYDFVVYIGHNGLMDFQLPLPQSKKPAAKPADCAVLCCKSQKYFQERIEAAGGRPVLLTTQFMYPGSFLLRAAANSWLDGGSADLIRQCAGNAYAQNQKLSKKAGLGVFAKLNG